jgi:hypothetical protein
METGGELVLPFYEAVGVDVGVEGRMTAAEDTAS